MFASAKHRVLIIQYGFFQQHTQRINNLVFRQSEKTRTETRVEYAQERKRRDDSEQHKI